MISHVGGEAGKQEVGPSIRRKERCTVSQQEVRPAIRRKVRKVYRQDGRDVRQTSAWKAASMYPAFNTKQ
jgi:hypothetical protein